MLDYPGWVLPAITCIIIKREIPVTEEERATQLPRRRLDDSGQKPRNVGRHLKPGDLR